MYFVLEFTRALPDAALVLRCAVPYLLDIRHAAVPADDPPRKAVFCTKYSLLVDGLTEGDVPPAPLALDVVIGSPALRCVQASASCCTSAMADGTASKRRQLQRGQRTGIVSNVTWHLLLCLGS